MNKPECIIKVKSVYGNTLIYPANDTAQTFAALAKTKTLSHADLCKIEALGFSIKQIHDELVL